jgi:hypothetical protein
MTTQRWIGSPAIAALLGIAVVFLGSSCGQSTSSATQATPSGAPSPTPATSPPPGGPVPAQLLGDWLLTTVEVDAAVGCHKPLLSVSCRLTLTLNATTYAFSGTYPEGGGDVVVNNTEIDFYTSLSCPNDPFFIGRYRWTLTGGVLHFKSLNNDPCARHSYLANENFYRTLV